MTSEPENPLANGVTAELYKAAIGSEGQDYYLRHFLQFDADGKAGATWHWPACGATLCWLVFRKMWSRALIYGVALLGLVLVIFGVGKLVFNYSDSTGMLLFLLFLTAAFVVPGLYANAWYYTDCSKKISTALRNAATVREACDVLTGQASTRRRMISLAAVNVTALVLVASGMSFVLDFGQEGAHLAQMTRDKPAVGELALTVQPVLAAASVAVPEPQAQPASQPAVPVPPIPPETVEVAPVSTDKPTSGTEQIKPVASAASVGTDTKPKDANARRQWFVQVGAFAREANVQKVRAKVEATGLVSTAEPSDTPAGRLIRVRVGPFDSKGEAERAALQIKALDLPAVLVRQ